MNKMKNLMIAATRLLVLAMAFCGLGVFTSCVNDDNPVTPQEDVHVLPQEQPTTDQLEVKIEGLTYVLDGDYKDVAKALVNRVTSPAPSISTENLQNIIIHADKISSLTTEQVAAILRCQANGGSLIIAEPTVKDQMLLMLGIYDVSTAYLDTESSDADLLTGVDYTKLSMLLNNAAIVHNQQLANTNFLNTLNEEPCKNALLSGLKGKGVYLSKHDVDENEEAYSMNDWLYGKKADEAARWMNETTPVSITSESNGEEDIKRLAQSIDYRIEKTANVDWWHRNGWRYVRPQIVLDRHIWTGYSFGKGVEYYCVEESATARNQNLACGPDKNDWWWGVNKNWETWKDFYKKYDIRDGIYGPFMKRFAIKNEMSTEKGTIRQEGYNPKNSGGSTIYSKGISYSLGADVGISSAGPALNVSGGIEWSDSRSRTVDDLTLTASSADNKVEWDWDAVQQVPDSHWGLPIYHDMANSILTTELVIPLAYVLAVENREGAWAKIHSTINYEADILTYSKGFYKTTAHYMAFRNSFKDTQTIYPPPHYKQYWSLQIDADGISGDERDKIKARLKSHLSAYVFDDYLFFTQKPYHSEQDDKGDEIRNYLKGAIDAFEHNPQTRDIINTACKDFGIASGKQLRFVWGQTNSSSHPSDKITYNFTANY